jgi:hypothetical protein
MSEYIEIDSELSDDGTAMHIYTNLTLSDEAGEYYDTTEALEEGSPVAQALAVIDGIATLRIEGGDMTVTRQPDAEWHAIVADISAAIKDFFL